MPVVISVLIFVLYYIIDSGATRVAKSGEMNIILGTWMSTIILAPLGGFLTYKSNKDSVVFNIDVYVNFFRKLFGIRVSRHVFKKEVIIHTPDYTRIYQDLDKLCQECETYGANHKLLGPPNYYQVFTNNKHDDAIKEISLQMEGLVEEMSNTKDGVLLNLLNNYPFLSVKAHKSVSDNRWLNLLIGIIVPAGLLIWLNIWRYRVRLDKDLKTIVKNSRDIQERIKKHSKTINIIMEKIKLNTIEEAIEDFRKGEFVIIVDDEDRENEGDLVVAAELITPEKVNFMLKHARGVLCAPITISRCEELDLPHQVSNNTSVLGTPFTVTIDKLEGCTTGVSAADRAATIRALADPTSKPETFGRPGHVNPLYAQEKGVLRRAGHTEACVDMARLAGLYPAAALMEVMNEDGTMARLPELKKMADEYGFKLISIADLIAYRLKQESLVEKGVEVDMPTEHGHFRLIPFRQKSNGLEHVALIKGTFSEDEPVLVRVHSSCATGDIFGSMRCDCGDQLHKAMEQIEKEGKGAVIYLNQEGRGIGLMEK